MNGPRSLWWSSVGLAIVAFVLGFLGYCEKNACSCELSVWDRDFATNFHALHGTLQLYVLNFAAGDIQTISMGVAALLAPLSIGGAVVYALWGRLAKTVVSGRLWLVGADHLFIGTGERATEVALAKARHMGERDRMRIGALDLDEHTSFRERLDRLRSRSIRHRDRLKGRLALLALEGNGLSSRSLTDVNARGAKSVWVMTADDELNLRVARRLLRIIGQQSNWRYWKEEFVGRIRPDGDEGRSAPNRWNRFKLHFFGELPRPAAGQRQRIMVRVSHTRLVRAYHALRDAPDAQVVEYFNLGRLVARQLFVDHPPVLPPLTTSPVGDASLLLARSPHIVLVGDGDLLEPLAVYAAMHWVLDDRADRRVWITLIGRRASAMRDRLVAEHPALCRAPGTWADLAFEYRSFARLVAIDIDSDEIEPQQWLELQSETPIDAVYVCATSDLATAQAAVRVRMLREAYGGDAAVPLVALLQQASQHGWDRGDDKEKALPDPVRFDVYRRLFGNDERFPGETLDAAAILSDRLFKGGDPACDPLEWPKDMTDAFKWSSRYSAAHLDVKVALVDKAMPGTEPLETKLGHHLDRLVLIEHRRFVAERLIDGWLRLSPDRAGATYDHQKKLLRLNTTLVPYDALSIDKQVLDRRVVLSIPSIRARAAAAARTIADRKPRRPGG